MHPSITICFCCAAILALAGCTLRPKTPGVLYGRDHVSKELIFESTELGRMFDVMTMTGLEEMRFAVTGSRGAALVNDKFEAIRVLKPPQGGLRQLVDANASGDPRLLTATEGQLHLFTLDGTELWALQLPEGHWVRFIRIGDLDGDGSPDVVAVAYSRGEGPRWTVNVLSAEGVRKASWPSPSWVSGMALVPGPGQTARIALGHSREVTLWNRDGDLLQTLHFPGLSGLIVDQETGKQLVWTRDRTRWGRMEKLSLMDFRGDTLWEAELSTGGNARRIGLVRHDSSTYVAVLKFVSYVYDVAYLLLLDGWGHIVYEERLPERPNAMISLAMQPGAGREQLLLIFDSEIWGYHVIERLSFEKDRPLCESPEQTKW